MYLKRTAVDWL